MTRYQLRGAAIGLKADMDGGQGQNGDVQAAPFGLYIAYDTGEVYIDTGSAWSKIGQVTVPVDASGNVSPTGNLTMANAKNIVLATSTGTKIGTATNQKLGFYNATPITQGSVTGALSTVADAPAKAALTSILAALVALGLVSDGTS